MSGADGDSDGGFVVNRILRHMKVHDLVAKIMKGHDYCYYPDSISAGNIEHSKYAFFVKWEGYEDFENTWEPQENVRHLEVYSEYKKEHNLDETEMGLKITKRFKAEEYNVLRQRSLDHQAKINATKERIAREAERKKRKSEFGMKNESKERQGIEVASKKEHHKHRFKSSEFLRNDSSSDESIAVPSSSTRNGEPPEKRKKNIDGNVERTPKVRAKHDNVAGSGQISSYRIPKKKDRSRESSEASKKDSSPSGNNQKEKRKDESTVRKREKENQKSRKEEKNGDGKVSRASMELGDDSIRPGSEQQRRSRSTEPKSEGTNKTKEPPMRIAIEAPLPNRPLEHLIEERKKRKKRGKSFSFDEHSLEQPLLHALNEVYETYSGFNRHDEVPIDRKLISVIDDMKTKWDYEAQLKEMPLIEANIAAVFEAFGSYLNENNIGTQSLIRDLVRSYTLDFFDEFEETFADIPDSIPILKTMIIHFLVSRCKTMVTLEAEENWSRRKEQAEKPFDQRFVETDSDVDFEELPQNYELCNKNHSKCTWLNIFLKLMPSRYRFMVRSSQKATEDDGPFRDDVFFHCLKYGATCQKMAFLRHDRPFGDFEEETKKKKIDHVHAIIIQGKSLSTIQEFVRCGFDMNSFAKDGKNGKLQSLPSYVEEWTERLEKKGIPFDAKYYEQLKAFINHTTKQMADTMVTSFCKRLIEFSSSHIEPVFDLTEAHVLHCSPYNNVANHGMGENQVLTCLFSPKGCRFSTGLRPVESRDIFEQDCQNTIDEMLKNIKEGRGRIVLGVVRVEIDVYEKCDDVKFRVVESDDGCRITKMTLLRQQPGLTPEEADIGLTEMTGFSAPGVKCFSLPSLKHETELVVPGMAHIEMVGHFEKGTNFLVQLHFCKFS